MSIQNVIEIVTGIIISVGGSGAIVCAVIKFSAEKIAERMNRKYQLELDRKMEQYKTELVKETEKYKTELSKREYVTKTKFDAEIGAFRELNAIFFDLVRTVNNLIPRGLHYCLNDEKAQTKLENEYFNNSCKLLDDSYSILCRNSIFLPKNIFDSYSEIHHLCDMQVDVIRQKYVVSNLDPQKGIPQLEDRKRTEEIDKLFDQNNESIRKHINSLEVLP